MFGRSLEETMAVETRLGGGYVPIFLHRCVTFLREHGGLHTAQPVHMPTTPFQPYMKSVYSAFLARLEECKI